MKLGQQMAILGVVLSMFFLLSVTTYSSLFAVRGEVYDGREFYVPEGVSLRWIAKSLEEQGFIQSSTLFLVLAKLVLSEKDILAGEYKFPPDSNLFEILRAFSYGRVNYRKVMIQPGWNIRQIGRVLASEGLMDEETFFALTRDRELIDLLGLPVTSLEGFLYPDTYYFYRGSNPRKMVRNMVLRFREVVGPELRERAREMGMTMEEVVTLASMIEAEAVVAEERPLISAVFHNRLKRGFPLQSDPTVIYALGDRFDGDLKREHLRIDSPYNTYVRKGLPPGPIGNPGIDSIRAALYPAKVDYFYFVSKNDGTHHFSKNLIEHNMAVAIYQKPLALKKSFQ